MILIADVFEEIRELSAVYRTLLLYLKLLCGESEIQTALIRLRDYDMEEETAICASCGREVPKTLYCIYCGSALFKMEQEPGRAAPSPERSAEQVLELIKPVRTVEEALEPGVAPPTGPQVGQGPSMEFAIDPDIDGLMEQLKNNYIWKVRLCGVLCDDGVSEEIFTRLFDEYVNKINQLSQVRNEKIAYYREDLGKRRAELDEVEKNLEELNVRVAVGQISSGELTAQTPELEGEIDRLTTETSKLDAQLARLNDLMRGASPKDIHDLEKTARRGLDSLDAMVTSGKVSSKLGNDLRKDLEAALNVFNGIIGDKKQMEKELRDDLSTLEARYKVGEINISKFEAQKRRINEELEKIWV